MALIFIENLFYNFFSILIISISVCGTGILLNKFYKIGYKLEELFFYGLFIKIILTLIINIFFSLNIYLNTFLIILGFFFFFQNFKNINISNNFNFLIFLPLIAIISLRDGLLFDNLLYHIPLINLAIESNYDLGQSNLNFRFATPTFIFNIYSSLYLPILKYNSLSLLNSTAFLFLIKFINDKSIKVDLISENIHKLLLFILLMDALIHPNGLGIFLNRLGLPEFDLLVGFLHIYFVFFIAKNIQKIYINNVFYLIILSALIFLVKPTIFSIIFLFFWTFALNKKKIIYLLKKNIINFILLVLFFILFFIKIFLDTGCIYPFFSLTCFNVSWYTPDIIKELSRASISWKGYTTNVTSLADFTWVKYWFTNFFLTTAYFNYFLILIFINILLFFKVKKNYEKIKKNDVWLKIIIFHFISLFLWFFSSPDIRFVWSTLLLIYAYLTFTIIKRLDLTQIFMNLFKRAKTIFFILLLLLSFKNIYFISFENLENKFLKKNDYELFVNKNNIKINHIVINNYSKYKLCGFTPNPCINDKYLRNHLNYKSRFIFGEYSFK